MDGNPVAIIDRRFVVSEGSVCELCSFQHEPCDSAECPDKGEFTLLTLMPPPNTRQGQEAEIEVLEKIWMGKRSKPVGDKGGR